MRITAISDIHGSLIPIEPTDLLIIAGDWSPLEIQQKIYYMRKWLDECLMEWFSEIEADKIIFIAGNHDFICDSNFLYIPSMSDLPQVKFEKDFLKPLLKKHNLQNKVKYLENNSTKYNGLKIYGCPYVDGCRGWAFCQGEYRGMYNLIPKCDILITHQPPLVDGVGRTVVNNQECEFGSWALLEAMQNRKPKYVFCGHIHDGNHERQVYNHPDGKQTVIHNVSIKNEMYNLAYRPTIIKIGDNND